MLSTLLAFTSDGNFDMFACVTSEKADGLQTPKVCTKGERQLSKK